MSVRAELDYGATRCNNARIEFKVFKHQPGHRNTASAYGCHQLKWAAVSFRRILVSKIGALNEQGSACSEVNDYLDLHYVRQVADVGLEVIDIGLKVIDVGLQVIDVRLEVIDGGLKVIDGGLEVIDGGLKVIDGGLEVVDVGLEVIDGGLEVIDGGMEVIDVSLDIADGLDNGVKVLFYCLKGKTIGVVRVISDGLCRNGKADSQY